MSAVDELQLYLTTEHEDVANPISWWYEKRNTYPRLYHMALDYLNIPGTFSVHWSLISLIYDTIVVIATSVEVERLFSQGCLVLSHTRSRLSVNSTRALICLGSWSLLGLVHDEDVRAVMDLDEIEGVKELDRLGDVLKARGIAE